MYDTCIEIHRKSLNMKIGIQTNFAAHSNEALIDKYDKYNPKCHRPCLFIHRRYRWYLNT